MKTTEDQSMVDIWSIPHFLSGIIIGLPLLYIGISAPGAFFILLVLSLAFEFVEYLMKVGESLRNMVMDVVLGLLAFFFAYCFFIYLSREMNVAILWLSILGYLLVVIPGWIRYMKKKKALKTF